jgi:hypothetical protein
MKYKKSVIEVKIRLDPIPGWGHEPDDHVKHIQHLLDQTVKHYKPEVKYIGTEKED